MRTTACVQTTPLPPRGNRGRGPFSDFSWGERRWGLYTGYENYWVTRLLCYPYKVTCFSILRTVLDSVIQKAVLNVLDEKVFLWNVLAIRQIRARSSFITMIMIVVIIVLLIFGSVWLWFGFWWIAITTQHYNQHHRKGQSTTEKRNCVWWACRL